MERLTEKRESGAWPKKDWAYEPIAECLDRLAAYEDTGLEPEQITASDWEILAKETLREVPLVDAVPVVRCRECAHYKICDEWENGKRMLCEIHHHSYLDHDGDNHFCSWGQRKIETVLTKSDAKDESLEVDHEVS